MSTSQIAYLRLHWQQFCWHVCKQTIAWLGVFLATYSGAVTVAPAQSRLQLFLADVTTWLLQGWPILLGVLLLMVISAIVNWPRLQAVYYDERTGVRVIVEFCDIFAQKGLKLIHSVDTFDTALGSIITPRSLHGAFLARCKQQQVDIDAQLDAVLPQLAAGELDAALPGRKQRYPLGTVCLTHLGDDPYALVSFTHLQPNGSIQITRREYTDFLISLWENLAQPNIRHDVVNVALMGNQFLDLPTDFTTEQKIDIMLQTFFVAARRHRCCDTLRICVHDRNALEVDFYHYPIIMQHLSKRPELQF